MSTQQSKQFDKLLFLGGSHKGNYAMCVNFVYGLVSVEKFLESIHKEADGEVVSSGRVMVCFR